MEDSDSLNGVQDIQKTLINYAKQETLDPLKKLGRYFGFGLIGSVFVALGVFFIGLGTLRFAQTLEVFEGSSWASILPYLITLFVLLIFLFLLFATLSRAKKKVNEGKPL